MKTKEECLGDLQPGIDSMYYPDDQIFKAMDEYAEEYVKAFLIWYSKLEVVNMSEITRNSLLAAFKESLKK